MKTFLKTAALALSILALSSCAGTTTTTTVNGVTTTTTTPSQTLQIACLAVTTADADFQAFVNTPGNAGKVDANGLATEAALVASVGFTRSATGQLVPGPTSPCLPGATVTTAQAVVDVINAGTNLAALAASWQK